MQTPLGSTLRWSGPSLWLVAAVSAAVVSTDLAFLATDRLTVWRGYVLAAIVVVMVGALATYRRDGASFGLRLSPLQGWAYWAKAAILLGLVLLLILSAAYGIVVGLQGYSIPARYYYVSSATPLWPLFVWMCVKAPLVEEVVYRLAVCPPVAAWLGPPGAIAVSGLLFAAAHVLGGNAAPDNLLAGFILAWAFLKSGTIAVPIALHSLGNVCAFAFQTVHFYWCA